ncbi:MAG: hypothetical protein ABL907_22730, partial [Hyphomicrobium sp.]
MGRASASTSRVTTWARCLPIAALLALGGAMAGCASTSDVTSALNPDPPSKMYADADGLMAKGKFDDAAKKFEDLDRDHPYAPEAR